MCARFPSCTHVVNAFGAHCLSTNLVRSFLAHEDEQNVVEGSRMLSSETRVATDQQ